MPALLLALGLIFVACAGSNTPEAVAQRFVDAVVAENFAAAADEMDVARMGREGALTLLVFFRAEVTRQYGPLRSATVERLERDDDSQATMLVRWQGERGEYASGLILARVANAWTIIDLPPNVPGTDGAWDSALPPGGEVPIPTASPLATPTPELQPVIVQLGNLDELSDQARQRIVVAADGQTQRFSLNFDGVWTASLPLGTHMIRVSLPGRADTQTSVNVTGVQAPDPIVATLGERLPIDVNTMVLTWAGFFNTWTINTIGPSGLTALDIPINTVRGLDRSGRTIQFADTTGLGTVGLDGSKTYSWQRPEGTGTATSDTWSYGPGYAEIAYVANNDVWTLETTADAAPQRWTEIGIFESVIGYVDADTVLVQTQSERHVLHRDGTSYSYGGSRFDSDLAPVRDRDSVHFLEGNGVYYQPGPTALVKRAEVVPSSFTGVKTYGWTADQKYLLVHSTTQEHGDTSGVVALDRDGMAHALAPELMPTNTLGTGALHQLIGDAAMAPTGSRMTLVWKGEKAPGVYLLDAAGNNAERILELVPQRLFWPRGDELIYVIESGPDMGTWRYSVDSGEPARKLFAYRATHATASPDGTLYLIANTTLWRVTGTSKPEIVGAEGQQGDISVFRWLTPAP